MTVANSMLPSTVEDQARLLAGLNAKDSSIDEIFWFPHPEEVRLVELSDELAFDDEVIQPFHFDRSLASNLPFPTQIALISSATWLRPAPLPEGWDRKAATRLYRKAELP